MLWKFWLGDEYRQALLDRPRPHQNVLQMFLPPPRKTAIIYWLLVYIYIYTSVMWTRSGEKSQMLEAPPQNGGSTCDSDVLSSTYLKGTALVKHALSWQGPIHQNPWNPLKNARITGKPKHCEDPNLYRSTHSCPCLERSPLSEFFGRYSSWC